jgi:hypothetical protein
MTNDSAIKAQDVDGNELAVEWILVDLDTAQELLKSANQDRNRAEDKTRVEVYSGGMLRNEWSWLGMLIFDLNNQRIDGYHRLTAFVRAATDKPELTLQALIVRGLPERAIKYIDVGKTRTLKDWLEIRGEPKAVAGTLGAALTTLWALKSTVEQNGNFRSLRPTRDQTDHLLDENPEIRDSILVAKSIRKRVPLMPGPGAALHYYLGTLDRHRTNEFFDQLANGVEDDAAPSEVLAQYLQKLRGKKTTREEVCASVINAWNLAVRGVDGTKRSIEWSATGGKPFPKPTLPQQ